MPKDIRAPGEWAVFDRNARYPDPKEPGKFLARIHDSALGISWPLRANEPCYMPEAHARAFLKDQAFRVLNADDEEMASLAQAQQQRRVPTNQLAPHLVVADLHELTTDALLTRAAQMPESRRITSSSTRETIINFLREAHASVSVGGAKPGDGAGDGIEQDAGVDIEDMDPEDTLAILNGLNRPQHQQTA